MKKVNIFLSYCWNDSNVANKIYDYFKNSKNIELHRDTINIGKWGSIKEYMQSISNVDYTILLISESYLKSANCMYEVLEVMRDRNYKDKIFPAVVDSEIYKPITRAKYVKHWQDEFRELENTLKEISVQNLGKLNEDLKQRQDISSNIADFLDLVSDMNNPNIKDICVSIEEKLDIKGFLGNNQIKNDLIEDSDYSKENINRPKGGRTEQYCEIPKKNRTQDYANKWNQNVFLNNYNERDENAGVNIKLSELYLEENLPHYVWKSNTNLSFDLKNLLKEYIVDIADKKMLLILGQPGIGKSTLITWIIANLVERNDEIFVYQFASDLGNVDWQGNDILENIFKSIGYGYRYRELEGKILILDGFDEIFVNGDNRERILSKMNQELKRMNFLKVFSLIITCRQNYVEQLKLEESDYITLQAWNKEQIKKFCENYEKENTRKNPETVNSKNLEIKINKILENEEVFGIPLILYMVLALNIDVEKSSSMVDIYDQIFSLKKGGIYDRCYDVEHRINSPEIREHIRQVSQRIAFWIFENNSEKASIPQKEFKKICDNVINDAGERNENLQSDVLIGNYFTTIKHCEGIGTDELQFVHRSIYEYFVTVYFFESIHKLTSKEEIAGKLGELFKKKRLSKQILEFVKYKFDSMKGYDLSDITKEIFNMMLRDDMTYHMKGKYKNIIAQEIIIFSNMLEVVHLWNPVLGKLDDRIVYYLQHNDLNCLNLRRADLSGAGLYGAELYGADLRESNLSKTNLYGADLSEADLSEADLSNAKLMRAVLSNADLSNANLSGAYLSEAVLFEADLSEADLSGADLSDAYLRGADLSEADLGGVDLSESNLSEANLSGADLSETNLRGADLSGADLSEANLSGADLSAVIFDVSQVDMLHKKHDLSDSHVFILETNEIISYKAYCFRRQKG